MNNKKINEFFARLIESRPVRAALRLAFRAKKKTAAATEAAAQATPRAAGGSRPLPSPSKILFIKLEGIGDSAYILEIIYRLKTADPALEIDVLTTARNPLFAMFAGGGGAAACAGSPSPVFGVETLEPLNPLSYIRTVKKINAKNYGVIFDLTGMPANVPLMLLFAKALKAGFSSTELRRDTYGFTADIDPDIHIFDNYLKVVNRFFDVSPEKKFTFVPEGFPGTPPQSVAGSGGGQPAVCLALSSGGGGNMSRRLPPANARRLIELVSDGFPAAPVYLVGGPEDYPYLESLRDSLEPRLKEKVRAARTGSLSEAARLLKDSLFNVCIDSGLMHLSSLVNPRTYCLFGYSSPKNSLPFNCAGYFAADYPCAPCSFYRTGGCDTLDCMEKIDVLKVAGELRGLFGAAPF